MPLVTLLLNVLWLVFGGIWMAAAWLVAAIIMALTIIGLPWARSALTIGVYTLLPFGHTIVDRDPRGTGPLGLVGNLVWLVLAGWRLPVAADERRPGALEERPPGPEHEGRGQHELNPGRDPGREDVVQTQAGDVASHLEDDDGHGEGEPDPEAPPHVGQLVVRLGLGGDLQRLERQGSTLGSKPPSSGQALPPLREAERACLRCRRNRLSGKSACRVRVQET